MSNHLPNLKSISTGYEDMESDAKCRSWDHSRTLETAPFDTLHTSSH